MDMIINYLKGKDKALGRIIDEIGKIEIPKKEDLFYILVKSIIYQQLSGYSAKSIFERFLNLFPDGLNPEDLVNMNNELLRKVGLSMRKIEYLKSISEKFIKGEISMEKLEKMSDEEIYRFMRRFKGVGDWTVEMILIFSLGRKDVFSPKDLGLNKAICMAYGFNYPLKEKELKKIAERWRPYRTLATLYLWKLVDNNTW